MKLFNFFYGPKKGFVVEVLPVYPGKNLFRFRKFLNHFFRQFNSSGNFSGVQGKNNFFREYMQVQRSSAERMWATLYKNWFFTEPVFRGRTFNVSNKYAESKMHSVNSFRNFLGLASPYETWKILPLNTGLVKSLFFLECRNVEFTSIQFSANFVLWMCAHIFFSIVIRFSMIRSIASHIWK